MMADIPGLPETSANLGVLSLKEDRAEVRLSVRSSVKRDCLALSQKVGEIAAAHGADSQVSGAYPPWEYRKESPLREVVARVYQEASGHPAQFNVIHAGLECGIFYEKFPDLDAVSFGPTILDIHSPKERFELASALRTWEFLLQLLAAL
jgi:dipeptidase D